MGVASKQKDSTGESAAGCCAAMLVVVGVGNFLQKVRLVVAVLPLVVGGWWLVVGGWWLVVGG